MMFPIFKNGVVPLRNLKPRKKIMKETQVNPLQPSLEILTIKSRVR